MNTLKPLAYGYMRVPDDIPDRKVRDMEQKLKAYAEALGYEYATIFHEFQCGVYDAWRDLTTELQRADAHHVLVPSMSHIAHSPLLRVGVLERLEDEAKAEVHSFKDDDLGPC